MSNRTRLYNKELILSIVTQIVELIWHSLPQPSEVLVHDLDRLPNSIIAVYGDITGRKVGDPATDILLRWSATKYPENITRYETILSDGRRISALSMTIFDELHVPIATICINSDVSAWHNVYKVAKSMIRAADNSIEHILQKNDKFTEISKISTESNIYENEIFAKNIDDLANVLISQSISEIGISPETMDRNEKIQFVNILYKKGFFHLKNAAEIIGQLLGVSRFTVYNYLKKP